jgi:hypothetical protein
MPNIIREPHCIPRAVLRLPTGSAEEGITIVRVAQPASGRVVQEGDALLFHAPAEPGVYAWSYALRDARGGEADVGVAVKVAAAHTSVGQTRSGLSWLSGMTPTSTFAHGINELRQFEAFRGRKCDVSTTFANWKEGWDAYLGAPGLHNGLQQALDNEGVRLIVSLATVVKGDGATIPDAAAGKYDRFYEKLADIMVGWNLQIPPILRINWEMSQNSRPYSPNLDNSPDFRDSKAMWRRAVEIDRDKLPDCTIDWCQLKRPSRNWKDWWPGDEWVDSVGAIFMATGHHATTKRYGSRIASSPNLS